MHRRYVEERALHMPYWNAFLLTGVAPEVNSSGNLYF